MARLILLLMFMALVTALGMTLKRCSVEEPARQQPSGNAAGLVALRDGSTMMAEKGTVGRDLVDWLAERTSGERTFELGGQEFMGRTAEPTPESIGRVPRLIAMLRANPDVHVTIVGSAAPLGDAATDRALAVARAQALLRLLRDGGISIERMEVRADDAAISPNAGLVGGPRSDGVTLILSRRQPL